MTGSLHHQLNLLMDLEIYERAEKLSAFLPEYGFLWIAADRAHDQLLKSAFICGFDPGGQHRHLSTQEWATRRAELIRRELPNHSASVRRAA